MSVSFDPVGNWFVVAGFAIVVTGLTLWAYMKRLRSSTGAWRFVALGLRLAAILLCLIASLRPSVVFQEKKKLPSTFIILTDDSLSMTLNDEADGESRWERARKVVSQARTVAKDLGEGLKVKSYLFAKKIHDDPADDKAQPEGKESAYGQAILDAVQNETGSRVAAVVLVGDGSNNAGPSPLAVARQLRSKDIPVITVGMGTESAGAKSRDLAVREVVTSPTVFVKNNLQIKGTILARGFPNERLELEMLVEGDDGPMAEQRIKVPASGEVIPFTGLSFRPQTPGEKKITVRVKPKEGELVEANNTFSTFVTVLKGGLNVLFVQGPHAPWEGKFWMLSVGSSPDIQGEWRVVRKPAREGNELSDDDFTPGRYDVYVLSDLPADFLSPAQQALVAHAVDKRSAGLIMLGGRSSFGAGGWDRTELARVLPMVMARNDPQIEPEAGIKFAPYPRALDNYLLQIGGTRAESELLWKMMPPLSGINRLGELKQTAQILGYSDKNGNEPIMVGSDVGSGRVLAFGGETWPWARASTETRAAHRKFWRQVIFWLAHKEDKGENEVKLRLDQRRIVAGQKLDFRVNAQDAKGAPLTGLKFETRVTLEGDPKTKYSEPVDPLFKKGDDYTGSFYANQAPPGDYRMTVVATRDGKEIGKDSARFIIYQDDRELENPAADRALLRQIAEATGGESLAPEQLPKYLQTLRGKLFTESYSQTERKIWDNWPFFLIFVSLLMLEWLVRKRHGWV